MKFSVGLDIPDAVKLANAITKQIPFAMAKALTLTAIQAQTDIVQAIAQVFDHPTPYTLNSTYVVPATKDRLEATVKLKNESAKGYPRRSTSFPKSPEEFVTQSDQRLRFVARSIWHRDRSSFQARE